MKAFDRLKSVLCGPDGKCCILGSNADRAIVDNALAEISQLVETEAGNAALRKDAKRWRRLVNASEMAFPVLTIANDPENDCDLSYGRKALEYLVDSCDELSDAYIAQPAGSPFLDHRGEIVDVLCDDVFGEPYEISKTEQPVQPTNLEAAVFDAWEHYERTGSVCRFEGRSMIYASTLEEIYEAAIALPVKPAATDALWVASVSAELGVACLSEAEARQAGYAPITQ